MATRSSVHLTRAGVALATPCLAVGAFAGWTLGSWLVPTAFQYGVDLLTGAATMASVLVGLGAAVGCFLVGAVALRRFGIEATRPPYAFELVHTVLEFTGMPHRGIADLDGRPHAFVQQPDPRGRWTSDYLLAPVDDDTLRLALEHGMLRDRAASARARGAADVEDPPALPCDRERYDELTALLAAQMSVTASAPLRRRAVVRAIHRDPDLRVLEVRMLQVCWLLPRDQR